MSNNTLKFIFVLIMVVLTFWSRKGLNVYSENSGKMTLREDRLVPLRATIAEAIPRAEPRVSEQGVLSAGAFVQKPHFYPISNFNLRTASIAGLVEGKIGGVLIADIDSGEDIFAYNQFNAWPIASLTKLMTAVIAIEQLGLDKEILISQSAVDTFGEAGGFSAGQKYKVSDLLKTLLQISSNDAAVALAEAMSAGEFVRLMNEKARELRMSEQTRFVDPTGLDSRNQSTLVDMKKLISYIYNHKQLLAILRISHEKEGRIRELTNRIAKKFVSINEFSGQSDFLGGKTGYIEESGGNLLSLFSRDGYPILVVVFGSDDRFGITRSLLNWFKQHYAITTSN